ncbi:MAG: sigma-70 family RNA polymerase sigma factor [Gammaproteobacteria bacterium]
MTDEELMLAVCEGDQSAYQTLVRQHLKPISHYAYRILGNQRDTEDISQEVFLRMWTNAAKWRPEKAKLSTWLHRITYNLCVDHLRKHGNTQLKEDLDDAGASEPQADSQSHGIDEQQQSKALDRAIANLPESQRSALMLCHYGGFSNKEAADIMNISVKALESNISRARRSLRTQLAEIGKLRGEAGYSA